MKTELDQAVFELDVDRVKSLVESGAEITDVSWSFAVQSETKADANWNKDHRKAELGFWLLPEFWGQGFMHEAVPLILDHAFNRMGIHRIEGFVESENSNCKQAIAKLNFVHEGTMRDCELKNGRFISVDVYAILKTD